MANTWTKEFPQVDGDYLCRINEHDLSPVSFRLENGAIYEYGCGKNLRSDYHHHTNNYEFLGPFTWRDFEQLAALREAATAAEQWIVNAKKTIHGIFHSTTKPFDLCTELTCSDARSLLAALREALKEK